MNREKLLNVFKYLHEFSKIRSTCVRDISISKKYPQVLWMGALDACPHIDAITFEENNCGDGFCLRVTKPIEPYEPECPKVPESAKEWVEEESLKDFSRGPSLRQRLDIFGEEEKTEKLLEDYPHVVDEFQVYIKNNWEPYKANYSVYKEKYAYYTQVFRVYKKLYEIYNKVHHFGEEYEAVLGVGLLNFKDSRTEAMYKRHLLTCKVNLDLVFDDEEPYITVSVGEDELTFETDLLNDLPLIFEPLTVVEADTKIKGIIKDKELHNPFDLSSIHKLLKLLIESVKPDSSVYFEDLMPDTNTPKKVSAYYAPAIMLRTRDTRSFSTMYRSIIAQLENADDGLSIPILQDVINNVSNDGDSISHEKISSKVAECVEDATIYFPNKFNDEQIDIIHKTASQNKVLVQGPPGTGKSHTIANLMCHLLATGNRILVTAFSKRALEVLKNKLPKEYQALCVNLMSGDTDSIKDLESSVNTIINKEASADVDGFTNRIEAGESSLYEIRKTIRETKEKLLVFKEGVSHPVALNESYEGTITDLSITLENEVSKYCWFKDDYTDYKDEKLGHEIQAFEKGHAVYKDLDCSVLETILPVKEQLPSEKELSILQNIEQDYNSLNTQLMEEASLIETDSLADRVAELDDIFKLSQQILEPDTAFGREIVKALSLDHDYERILAEYKVIQHLCESLAEYDLSHMESNLLIEYNKDGIARSPIILKNDAKALLSYMQEGNKLSGIGFAVKKAFMPVQLKEKLYFIQGVLINGSPCDTVEEFQQVIDDLHVREVLDTLAQKLKIEDSRPVSIVAQKSQIDECIYRINQSLNRIDKFRYLVEEFAQKSNLVPDARKPATIVDFYKLYSAAYTCQQYKLIKDKEERVGDILNGAKNDEIALELWQAITKRDTERYALLLKQLQTKKEAQSTYNDYISVRTSLENKVPCLLDALLGGKIVHVDTHQVYQAIKYNHARKQLSELLASDDEASLIKRLHIQETSLENTISALGCDKAWLHTISKLSGNPGLKRHLAAWTQAVKRIGKTGKGKRALANRKLAQQEMEHCKEAVPCWIMPLYKVAETISPSIGVFDYVIVDEASQLGPDALFLMFIAKKIIIVGDDKQTSPEYVGVDASTMLPYQQKYLSEIPFKEYYGTQTSFFDHARIFCNHTIVLREHFRCMPEIIQFSNKQFYEPTGYSLFPMKQYAENRLEPLCTYYCKDAEVEGLYSSIRNQKEASAIVALVKDMIKDKRYDGKSMGVIVLQGSAQATLIENTLISAIGEEEYMKRNLICGNSASFQGDERDVIFLSLVTAPNHNRRAVTREEDQRKYNVAVSRAIEQIWLVHSIKIDDLENPDDLRYKLMSHFYNRSKTQLDIDIDLSSEEVPKPFDSKFEVDVYKDIRSKGYTVYPQYEVANGRFRIDMVTVFPDGTKIAIECDGDKWHGPDRYLADMQRQKVLERCGWQFFRVRGGDYYFDREKAMAPLWKIFETINQRQGVAVNQTNQKFTFEAPSIVKDEVEQSSDKEVVHAIDGEQSILKEDFIEVVDAVADDADIEIESVDVEVIAESVDDSIAPVEGEETAVEEPALCYYNLFESGQYTLSDESSDDAVYSVKITDADKHGYLLFCYSSGHINKVKIPALLSKRRDHLYANGINKNNELVRLVVLAEEMIVGVFYTVSGITSFKAHYTECISSREQCHLQGMKVAESYYDKIEYKFMSLEVAAQLQRLIYTSFNARGKEVGNRNYEEEFRVIDECVGRIL